MLVRLLSGVSISGARMFCLSSLKNFKETFSVWSSSDLRTPCKSLWVHRAAIYRRSSLNSWRPLASPDQSKKRTGLFYQVNLQFLLFDSSFFLFLEIVTLKQRLSEAHVLPAKMREYLVRSLYIEMLGHDASFAYIHAVKLTHDKNYFCKRIGYLVCSLCLHNKHELLLLLINTIQKVRIRESRKSILQLDVFWLFVCAVWRT